MPYVITRSEPFNAAEHVHRPAFTRRAVATLEEAREAVQTAFVQRAKADAPAYALIDEVGGTVGPLPDGTVIEVEPVATNWIIGVAEDRGAEFDEDASDVEIFDTFNAQEAARA